MTACLRVCLPSVWCQGWVMPGDLKDIDINRRLLPRLPLITGPGMLLWTESYPPFLMLKL